MCSWTECSAALREKGWVNLFYVFISLLGSHRAFNNVLFSSYFISISRNRRVVALEVTLNDPSILSQSEKSTSEAPKHPWTFWEMRRCHLIKATTTFTERTEVTLQPLQSFHMTQTLVQFLKSVPWRHFWRRVQHPLILGPHYPHPAG